MKTQRILTLMVLPLLLSLPQLLSGQSGFREGYILTLERDTVAGEVKVRNNAKNFKSCLFRKDLVIEEYTPDQILGFGYTAGKAFTSEVVEGSFAEALVFGQLSIYKQGELFVLKTGDRQDVLEQQFEVKEKDGVMISKESSRWRGVLTTYLSDCLSNVGELSRNIAFSEKSLTEVVVRYNRCKEADFVEYKSRQAWTEVELGLIAGVSFSTVKVPSPTAAFEYLEDSYSSTDPNFGVMIAISSPRVSDRLALQIECQYFGATYTSTTETTGIFAQRQTVTMDLGVISVPISARYSLTQGEYGVYVQGGVVWDYHFNTDTEVFTQRVDGTGTDRSERAFALNDSQVGLLGGVGISKTMGRMVVHAGVRYLHMYRLNTEFSFAVNSNRLALNLIVSRK